MSKKSTRILPEKSLSRKIVILAVAVATLTALGVGVLFYFNMANQAYNEKLATLKIEAATIAPLFNAAIRTMHDDLSVMTETPPINGLIRARRNKGIDPLDQSTEEAWRSRLEIIFTSFLKHSEFYTQIRFVGFEDNGRKIVRVNRTGNLTVAVPKNELQEKENEPYFTLAQNLEAGKVYYSAVTLNREWGQIQYPATPTMRAIIPVNDSHGEKFGFLVINAAYEKILESVVRKFSVEHDLYVLNDNGDYLKYKHKSGLWQFFSLERKDRNEPEDIIQKILGSEEKENTFHIRTTDHTQLVHYVKMLLPEGSSTRYVAVAVSLSEEELLKETLRTRRLAAVFGGILVLLSAFGAALFSRALTKPLNHMISQIRSYDETTKKLDLPVKSNDEIGELARAFTDMIDRISIYSHAEEIALARLKAVTDNALDGIIVLNEKGRITSYNKACEKIFGYKATEMTGQSFLPLLSAATSEDLINTIFDFEGDDKTDGGSTKKELFELEGQHKSGTIFPLEASVSKLMQDGVTLSVIILRDISERKAAEEERETNIQALERSNKELDDFAYIASHDLKEPLRGISNNAMFLEEDYAQTLDKEGKKRLNRIMFLSKRLETLINDLLYFSRLGRQEFAVKPTDLNDIIADIEKTHETLLEDANAKIIVKNPLPTITCDSTKVTEIFRNLITNAIKYNKSPEKIVEIDCTDTYPTIAGYVFSVRDNGIGIDERHHEDIFRIFKRLNVEDDDVKGTGVGLTFIQKIIQRHGGEIWVESRLGEGATFYFTLCGTGSTYIE